MSARERIELQRPTNTMLSLLALLLSISSFLFGPPLSHAEDSIPWGGSLYGNQTLVSKGGKFVLGVFSTGNSHNLYAGIWYGTIPVRTVVWVANREVPFTSLESAELKFSQDGNLVLLNNPSKVPLWSTNHTFPKSSPRVAVLLDSGNLVLKESLNSSAFLWESFDHPTDTCLPNAYIGFNKVTGEYQTLTSWKNSEDPSPGIFSHCIDPAGSSDFLTVWNRSVAYDHTGQWDGHNFRSIPQNAFSSFFRVAYFETKERRYIANAFNPTQPVRLVIDWSGQVKLWTWLEKDQKWVLFFSRPPQCDVYSICGPFGVCHPVNANPCSCLPGFEPKSGKDWNLSDWSGGCVRRYDLQCVGKGNSKEDFFRVMSSVMFPQDNQTQNLQVADAEECKSACLKNCGCSAYAYDGGCQIWNGQIHSLQQLSSGDSNGKTLYLRLSAREQSPSGGKSKSFVIAISVCVVGFLFLSLVVITSLVYRSRRRASSKVTGGTDGSLFQYNYPFILQITKNFSVLLGRGGFGSVFAGELPDSTLVAVKRLEGLKQGEKQFRAEVRTLGTVQHVNLVRLRGFCSQGERRLLVYEYMPQGSLDAHLFRAKPPYLSWRTRYQIALGTARGLAYLHEECRELIIHCDIKPENILLDESYQPKVADFGMAKFITRDFSRVLTTMRGTIGYLAPEWISGLAITPRADVYSFGMMLLELVSGQRNVNAGKDDGKATYFPILVARTINEGGDLLRLLDHRLGGDADVEELTRLCKAACWCIQDEESDRPTMGQVIQILEGVRVPTVAPVPRMLLYFVQTGFQSGPQSGSDYDTLSS